MHALRFLAAAALAAAFLFAPVARSQSVQTTTVSGTVYKAGGAPASGTLQISWPGFTTAGGQAIAAGRTSATIGANGSVSVALAPNIGAMPAGLFYTAVYHLSDGTTSTEYWVVPNTIQATIAQVRSTVMPAVQAVQAVNKAYVDQSIAQAVSSQITPSGGTLTGPLYLAGDPTQAAQAANKRYVDSTAAQLLPLSGGTLSGPVTAPRIGAVLQADQFPGSDFGAQLQACVNALDPAYGGTCDARNFAGQLSMATNLTLSVPNLTVFLPCSTIATAASIVVPAGTRNVSLHGCASRGTTAASGAQGGTVLLYSGNSALLQVGDPSFLADTKGFRMDSAALNITAASSGSAQAMAFYRTQEISLVSLYVLGNGNQTALTLDGTGNYTGGTFEDMQITGFQTAVNGIGHTIDNPATTDWLNASAFLRVHIDCPTQNGSPVAGTTGINLAAGDGNTFTGGDVEGCSTALHLGAHAENNTILGMRNENSTTQIQADAGSSYNNWITGGTMFTGKLVDNGTRNSFLDTFHRSFNALNGDWYGSQQDATVTNHFRLGTGANTERGLLNRYQTDFGYRWTTGLSDAASGIQYYQVLDELNNVYRLSIGQYNNGQGSTNNQTVVNAAGTGAVILNGSNNAGTGGVVFGSGGPASTTVATIDKSGNANFTGTLQVGGTAQSTGTLSVRNNADAEVDYYLWPGATASQKGSFTYKDFNGASQWYMLKDQNNNWSLNSAVGGLDSFKAYQSTNSGDTYINASNATGHIRLNYETGAGAETDIYSGSGSSLAAAFLGPTAIKLPGLAAGSARNCLQIDSSGYLSNTGSACGVAANVAAAGLMFNDGSVQTTSQQGALTGQANDATARTAAAAAETDAQTGITNAASANSAANQAETDAQRGIANAAAAQTSANNALGGQANDATARTAAATSETDAETGIANAATAQAAANQAETDAQTGIANAAAAQTSANNALGGQGNDATARSAAAQAGTNAASALAVANAALPANGALSTGTGSANVVQFPGTVAATTSISDQQRNAQNWWDARTKGVTFAGSSTDDTSAWTTGVIPALSNSGVELPSGNSWINPGPATGAPKLLITGANFEMRGITGGFGTNLKDFGNNASSAPMLQLGNGTLDGINPNPSYTVSPEHLDILNLTLMGSPSVAYPRGQLYFASVNLSHYDHVNLWQYDTSATDSVGMGSFCGPYTTSYLQGELSEMTYLDFHAFGASRSIGTGIKLCSPTGTVSFYNSSSENWRNGIRFTGSDGTPLLHWNGGRFERMGNSPGGGFAFWVDQAQAFFEGTNWTAGAGYLGPGTFGSHLTFGANGAGLNTPMIDDGLGNVIKRASANSTNGQTVNQDGTEWYRVTNNANPDPTFSTSGTTGWTATNATVSLYSESAPGAPSGQTLYITPTTAGGYISQSFSVSNSTDYLLLAEFKFNNTDTAAQIQVYDQSNTLLYDSGSFGAPQATPVFADSIARRLWNALIPSGTATSFTVRVIAPTSGASVSLEMLSLFKSATKMGSVSLVGTASCTAGTTTTPGGTCTVGGGNNGAVSSKMYWTFSQKPYSVKLVFHAKINSGAVAPECTIGGTTQGTAPAGAQVIWLPTDSINSDLDYILYLPTYPTQLACQDYSSAGTGVLTISKVAIEPIGTLPPQAANTLLGNSSNASGAPSAVSVPACSTALQWTAGTGFVCAGASTSKVIPWTAYATYASTGATDAAGDILPIGSAGATLVYFSAWYLTAGAGCTTPPVLSVYDKTASTIITSLTLANGSNSFDSTTANSGTPISVSMPANHNYSFRWTTAAVGCSTAPASVHVEAVYQQ